MNAKNTTPQPSLNRKPSEQSFMYEIGRSVPGGEMSAYAVLDFSKTSTPKSKGPEEKLREKGGKVDDKVPYTRIDFQKTETMRNLVLMCEADREEEEKRKKLE